MSSAKGLQSQSSKPPTKERVDEKLSRESESTASKKKVKVKFPSYLLIPIDSLCADVEELVLARAQPAKTNTFPMFLEYKYKYRWKYSSNMNRNTNDLTLTQARHTVPGLSCRQRNQVPLLLGSGCRRHTCNKHHQDFCSW